MTLVVRHLPIYIAAALLVVTITHPTAAVSSSDSVHDVSFANGIRARVFSAEYLESATEIISGTRGVIRLPNGGYLSVVTNVDDPLIANKGDGQFHPFRIEQVLEFLSDISYTRLDVEVDVFILPYPRANVLVSSASSSQIFLSPQVLEISREGAAYIVAHEFGHIFQNRYLPDRARRSWDEYRQLRGIANRTQFADNSRHADRPEEIFAEDFRVLFGGAEARFGGQIENTGLTRPEQVSGLRGFFARLTATDFADPFIVGVGNYPNPFNPATELRIQLADDFVATGERVVVQIFDVRGARVKELYSAVPDGPDLRIQWDGSDHNGRDVASQTYFAVVRAGEHRITHKLLMIK